MGRQNSPITFENSLTVFRKVKCRLPYDPQMLLLGIYLRNMKIYTQIDLYTNVHDSTVHSSQKSANNLYVHLLGNKQITYPLNKYYSATERNKG